ncbi:hypothetical protein [Phytoactinopolyspora endophytica]|uniref:hypothetical protein n=1 Tax=Phytoactinopolyspora endophytica TaxID=1642495 RepID=UPI00101B6FD6|nr:hypothetical protein [Phytoactinopolyspora endophytica]
MSAFVNTAPRTWRRGLRCGRQLGLLMARVGGLWFLPIVVVVFFALGIIQAGVGGFEDGSWRSVWEDSLQPMRYFPLAMSVIVGAGLMPNYVSLGLTRREFSVGAALMVFASSVGFAVAGTLGHQIERAVFGWFDEVPTLNAPHLFSDSGDVLAVFGEYSILTGVHMAAGLLIGATYYRFGGLIGTALLPFTVAPILAVELLLSASYFGNVAIDGFGWERQPLPLVIPACLGIIAVTLWGHYLFIRRQAIKP